MTANENSAGGEVFELTPAGKLNVLHLFTLADNVNVAPGDTGPLTIGEGGVLFGLSHYGGAKGLGAVFTMLPGGTVKVLHSFCSQSSNTQPCADGAYPNGGLVGVRGVLGNISTLYGTTYAGGKHGLGTVFKVSVEGGFEVIYSFDLNGSNPNGSLIRRSGTVYGTTASSGGVANGSGTIFLVTRDGHERVLCGFGRSPWRRRRFQVGQELDVEPQ